MQYTPKQILSKYWQHSSFRPAQKDIITSVLNGKDTLALLPTGGGKSVCYQVPALLSEGVTLVISPLISLMEEQVATLKNLEIDAACITAGMHYTEARRTLENTIEGAYDLLYISPERLQTNLFNEYLPAMDIRLIAVDEAHCVSQWGHDFRPDYLKISYLKEVFRNIPMLALTASATPEVEADIIKQLKLKDVSVFRQSFERKNIFYEVKYSENKISDIVKAIHSYPVSPIIYCRSRKATEFISHQLQQHGIQALPYHAGMPMDIRKQHQELWKNNSNYTMVATTAFGMGIDKPDVSAVIHYDIPEHLEAYYQEAGRAGRNGDNAASILLYNNGDIKRLQENVETLFPSYDFIRIVYQSVAEYLQIPIGAEPNRYYDFDLQSFCTRFSLPLYPASRALKLLEQEGLWTLTESVFKPANAQFIADRAVLDSIGKNYHELGLLITTMLRLYGTLFYHPTTINLKVIARHLKTKAELVEKMLVKLHEVEVITLALPKEGAQMYFHHYRVKSDELIINTERINILKQKHIQRIGDVITYTTNEKACRTKLLLTYFGENTNRNCGHCDVCKANAISGTNNRYNSRTIINILEQEQEIAIQSLVSMLSDIPSDKVLDLIRTCIDEGIIEIKHNNILSLKK